jgi:phosphorylcholine metabolism protein LicD
MKKMTTFLRKDYKNLSLVINEMDRNNYWVLDETTISTRKYDGTACAIMDSILYKRYDVKKGRKVPYNGIASTILGAV